MEAYIQEAKTIVRNYYSDFDSSSNHKERLKALKGHTCSHYHWRGVHPFGEQDHAEAVCEVFWNTLFDAFSSLQRREEIFFAGQNDCTYDDNFWVVSMGKFMGFYDKNWLGIPATGKLLFIPYAEFHKIEDNKITETALFCDILDVMHQAGCYPLPPMTGTSFVYPGPRTQDGLLFTAQSPLESEKTLNLINKMISQLSQLNTSDDISSKDSLRETWHEDMVWYGPCGIGATYTIDQYQKQHQTPFRKNLKDKLFNGHISRFSEGNYCGFFGWPNLNNINKGGFLGLPASEIKAPMRVVDIYRRAGDKIAENWVFIDLLYYLYKQGLDILLRTQEIYQTHKK